MHTALAITGFDVITRRVSTSSPFPSFVLFLATSPGVQQIGFSHPPGLSPTTHLLAPFEAQDNCCDNDLSTAPVGAKYALPPASARGASSLSSRSGGQCIRSSRLRSPANVFRQLTTPPAAFRKRQAYPRALATKTSLLTTISHQTRRRRLRTRPVALQGAFFDADHSPFDKRCVETTHPPPIDKSPAVIWPKFSGHFLSGSFRHPECYRCSRRISAITGEKGPTLYRVRRRNPCPGTSFHLARRFIAGRILSGAQ